MILEVSPFGNARWELRFMLKRKAHVMGLGQFPHVSLARAREEKDKRLAVVATGENPIEVRRPDEQPDEQPPENLRPFGEVAADYIKAQAPGWRSATNRKDWERSLLFRAKQLADRPIASISINELAENRWRRLPLGHGTVLRYVVL